jgi:hypothetical protein
MKVVRSTRSRTPRCAMSGDSRTQQGCPDEQTVENSVTRPLSPLMRETAWISSAPRSRMRVMRIFSRNSKLRGKPSRLDAPPAFTRGVVFGEGNSEHPTCSYAAWQSEGHQQAPKPRPHNPKVAGSNPAPATRSPPLARRAFGFCEEAACPPTRDARPLRSRHRTTLGLAGAQEREHGKHPPMVLWRLAQVELEEDLRDV